jgi:hypothetical protein
MYVHQAISEDPSNWLMIDLPFDIHAFVQDVGPKCGKTYSTEHRENGHRQRRRRRSMNAVYFKSGETKIILPLAVERKSRLYISHSTLFNFVENTYIN